MTSEQSEEHQHLKLRGQSPRHRARRRRVMWLRLAFVGAIFLACALVLTLSGFGLVWRLDQRPDQRPAGDSGQILAKKSLPLSSTTMNAGKSATSIFQTASMPSSGYSSISTFLMQSSARRAAGPPIDPK